MNKEMDVDYLDKHFPKGKDERRGEAMVLIGLARIEGNYLTKIRDVLQREYDRHTKEMERHRLINNKLSNRQTRKIIKHFHKKFQTEHIAELLNIKLDKKLNQIDFLKSICNPENSDYRAIKERIEELNKTNRRLPR